MTDKKKIGLIGAGNMGAGLAHTLIRAGYPLAGMALKNRGPVDDLIEAGASEFSSLEELAGGSDVILACLPGPDQVRVLIGKLLELADAGTIIIDSTSSDPNLTRELAETAEAKNIHLLDAPLLGGPKLAREGKIGLVVGGSDAAVEAATPILNDMAANVFFSGAPGTGHTTKLLNNAVTLSNSAILYETFAVAKKMGVDYEMLYKVMDTSAASSKRLHDVAPRLINDDHSVTFALNIATKDLVLYSEMAGKSGVPTLMGDASKAQYRLVQSMGHGEENVTAISTTLYQIASTEKSAE